MSRIEKIIEEIKSVNTVDESIRPWIYNEDGEIKDDVIVGNVLLYLEDMKDYEIEADDEYIEYIRENGSGYNTYNWGANIDHDIQYYTIQTEDGGIDMALQVHRLGDVRGNYTDFAVCHFEYDGEWFELENLCQPKMINDRYVADIDIFSNEYNVYDTEDGCDVGYYYETEVKDLLESINK